MFMNGPNSSDAKAAGNPKALTRRTAIKHLSVAAGIAGALPWLPAHGEAPGEAPGAEPPRLDVKDPAAVALGYVEHASQIDAKKTPGYVPGSNCENCLQLQGVAGNNYRPCSLFPGKLVSVSGWCTGWTAEM
jgi:hypothetical protein